MGARMNERLKTMGLNLCAEMIEHLNAMDDDTLNKNIEFYERKTAETSNTFDSGTAQVLRLYKTARFIGRVANRKP